MFRAFKVQFEFPKNYPWKPALIRGPEVRGGRLYVGFATARSFASLMMTAAGFRFAHAR